MATSAALDWRSVERLPSRLPDFTRLAWTSDAARLTWQPRLAAIGRMWAELERLSVAEGLRSCALLTIDPGDLVDHAGWACSRGLAVVPLARQALDGALYSAVGRPAEAGEAFSYRAVLGSADRVLEFHAAWNQRNDSVIGALLGYPDCCRGFFGAVWVDAAWVDTTWPMACSTADAVVRSPSSVEVHGPWTSNILLRWLGVRPVFHLPCRFDCAATSALSGQLLDLAARSGHGGAVEYLREALEWPIEWSALHGIAEIKTPVVKISARTAATSGKLTVRRPGRAYPQAGASGIRFPLRLEPARPAPLDDALHAQNGFATRAAMEQAHEDIVAVAASLLTSRDPGATVFDLGCGNGALLASIAARVAGTSLFGIDTNEASIDRGRRQVAPAAHLIVGNLHDAEDDWPEVEMFDLVILMPGRLLEVSDEQARHTRSWLARRARHLLVYAYSDWQDAHGTVDALAEKAGLDIDRTLERRSACAIAHVHESPAADAAG